MSHRNLFRSLRPPLAGANLVYQMKYVRPIESAPTVVADANRYVFEDDESVLVFEGLTVNNSRSHCAFAVFATISIHNRVPRVS